MYPESWSPQSWMRSRQFLNRQISPWGCGSHRCASEGGLACSYFTPGMRPDAVR